MASTQRSTATAASSSATGLSSRRSFYLWVAVVLAVAVTAVILGWHSSGGTPDPSNPANHMSRTTAVINSAILVFREGLETILVLAAVMASFLGANKVYRRPVVAGGGVGLVATIATWFAAVWLIGQLGGRGLDLQAATGLPAIFVLLVVMNWLFHRVYWTG
jgi:high-affinity iron transporter